MGQAIRKTLKELLEEVGKSIPIILDNFWDINDENNPDSIDRAVISTYDPDTGISYSGAVQFSFGFPENGESVNQRMFRVKAYFRQAWSSRDCAALLCKPIKEGTLPILSVPEDAVLPVIPAFS